MRRIIGSVFQSLDGVIQAPGGPTEDWTGGFAHGGWMPPLADERVGEAIGRIFAGEYDLLLGRRTYEIFAAYWPYQPDDGPAADISKPFNATAKHVLTRDPAQPLDWHNSHRLADIAAVAALKATVGPDLIIQGSGSIYPALLEAGLLDRLTTMTFPLVLGRGRRWFGDATPARTLTLVEHEVTPAGAIIATYEPAGAVESGTYASEPPSAREAARQARLATEG